MGKRRQPFGYQLEWGRIKINPPEAEIVQYIFQSYTRGNSYKDLTTYLLSQPIRYDSEKDWNKNIIARILEDERYLGQKEYPAIIQQSIFQKAAQKRLEKQTAVSKTEAQKILRRLCGQAATKQIEENVLKLLNGIINNPNQIYQPFSDKKSCSDEEKNLERELETLMSEQTFNENKAKECVIRLAEARYSSLRSTGYETQRLRQIFRQKEPMQELDADVLQAAVSEICVLEKGVITIRLKNGQSLTGR